MLWRAYLAHASRKCLVSAYGSRCWRGLPSSTWIYGSAIGSRDRAVLMPRNRERTTGAVCRSAPHFGVVGCARHRMWIPCGTASASALSVLGRRRRWFPNRDRYKQPAAPTREPSTTLP